MSSNTLGPLTSDQLNDLNHPTYQYTSFNACGHLKKVLSSSAKDMVVKNYGLGVRVSLLSSTAQNLDQRHSQFKSSTDGRVVDFEGLLNFRAKALKCNECLNSCDNTFMCLQCPYVGCWSESHALNHTKKAGHIFGIDSHQGFLYCFKCATYVSDPMLEIVRAEVTNDSVHLMEEYTQETDDIIAQYTYEPSFKATSGLRGFVNMGATCFMSSILQTLIHNPFVRDHFLSGGHFNCPKQKNECIPCCIDEIFIEFFSQSYTNGYGPVNLLTAAWNTKRSLAGYSEQDAHEFWQFLLDEFHKYHIYEKEQNEMRNGGSPKEESPDISNCECISHRTFAGELQSTITCSQCHSVTTTIDPMIDLSLEISSKLQRPSGSLMSLYDCLDRFTKKEDLDVSYRCSVCQERTKAVKQLSIKRLPPVLGIQLKRFEHTASASIKLDAHIHSPFFLDMSKYMTKDEVDTEIQLGELTYELFALVCHVGSVNTGHYTAIIKNRDGQWFKFDDSMVTLVNTEEVSRTRAYLLFYIVHQI